MPTSKFDIIMPTSDAYTRYAEISLELLRRNWKDHPRVHLLHYYKEPQTTNPNVTKWRAGNQENVPWTNAFLEYLTERYVKNYFLLMLDDYALFRPVDTDHVNRLVDQMEKHPEVACVHLSYQPIRGLSPPENEFPFQPLPRWDYTVNTQAALWSTSEFMLALSTAPNRNAWEFEKVASKCWNLRTDSAMTCQAIMPLPRPIHDCADMMDKCGWVLRYNNLCRHGAPDARHADFLRDEGFSV